MPHKKKEKVIAVNAGGNGSGGETVFTGRGGRVPHRGSRMKGRPELGFEWGRGEMTPVRQLRKKRTGGGLGLQELKNR